MSVRLEIDETILRPLLEQVVSETIERLDDRNAKFGGRLSYRLSEAAALLGVPAHTLRDARRRGEIGGKVIGRKLVFSRDELIQFLDKN